MMNNVFVYNYHTAKVCFIEKNKERPEEHNLHVFFFYTYSKFKIHVCLIRRLYNDSHVSFRMMCNITCITNL